MRGDANGSRRACSERGQASLVIIIFLAVFLLGATGLATDYTQIWAHRQMIQGAADAACQAGAADLLKALDAAGLHVWTRFVVDRFVFDCSNTGFSALPICVTQRLFGIECCGQFSRHGGGARLSSGFGVILIRIRSQSPIGFVVVRKTRVLGGTFNVSAKAECG
jgi:hypothetical protein